MSALAERHIQSGEGWLLLKVTVTDEVVGGICDKVTGRKEDALLVYSNGTHADTFYHAFSSREEAIKFKARMGTAGFSFHAVPVASYNLKTHGLGRFYFIKKRQRYLGSDELPKEYYLCTDFRGAIREGGKTVWLERGFLSKLKRHDVDLCGWSNLDEVSKLIAVKSADWRKEDDDSIYHKWETVPVYLHRLPKELLPFMPDPWHYDYPGVNPEREPRAKPNKSGDIANFVMRD